MACQVWYSCNSLTPYQAKKGVKSRIAGQAAAPQYHITVYQGFVEINSGSEDASGFACSKNASVNTFPKSRKRKASENDGTCHSSDSGHLHTPKRRTHNLPLPPRSTPPTTLLTNSEHTSEIKTHGLGCTAAQKYIKSYLQRHAKMETDSKFRLGSSGSLEDHICQYFRSAENEKDLYQSLLASNIIDWKSDGEVINRALNMDKVNIDALHGKTVAPQLPQLPADQEAWADSLMILDDDELQRMLHHLNRPDAMSRAERTRNRWATSVINRWLELLPLGSLNNQALQEHQFATMIVSVLVDFLLSTIGDMKLFR